MANEKGREKGIARTYFVDLGKNCKEISVLIGVSEVTLGKWRKAEGWDDLRAIRLSSRSIRTDNIRQIINSLSEQRIELSERLRAIEKKSKRSEADITEEQDLLKRIVNIDDAVSKWNKTLESTSREGKISVADHIAVMDDLFNELRKYDEKLYLQTIDFQEHYVTRLTSNG